MNDIRMTERECSEMIRLLKSMDDDISLIAENKDRDRLAHLKQGVEMLADRLEGFRLYYWPTWTDPSPRCSFDDDGNVVRLK